MTLEGFVHRLTAVPLTITRFRSEMLNTCRFIRKIYTWVTWNPSTKQYEVDSKGNVKTRTLHSARASRFSVNFYTVPAQLRREMTKFLRVRFLGRIQKRICDLNSYGFFITTKTEDPKKDHLPWQRHVLTSKTRRKSTISYVWIYEM